MERTIEKIAELEGLGAIPGQTSPEEDSGKPPEFITTPADLTLTENSLAHFECQLTPVNDSSMRVEWFHNGKPLCAGSRIKTINDFGFVILEVAGVYQRDSGLYTCKVFLLKIGDTKGLLLHTDLANSRAFLENLILSRSSCFMESKGSLLCLQEPFHWTIP
jgi:hypothetical protein